MVEVKVTAASIGALGAGIGIALLNGLVGNSQLLGGLPPWAQFVVVTVAPPIVAFLAGYNKASQTSSVSDEHNGAVR